MSAYSETYFATDAASDAKLNGTLFDDEPMPTSIQIVETQNSKSNVQADIYNLNGQRISSNRPSKGIYIFNGHKVVVK